MNYFELFEIPVSLTVAQNEIQLKYFDLQKKYPPDFYLNAGEQERANMLEKSSLVNKAFNVFKDPDETIKYVLQLKSLLYEEENYELPLNFLTEMMELNEAMKDSDILNIEEVETKIFQAQKILYDEVQNIIEYYNDDNTTEVQLLQVKDYYYKKKYLKRILERLDGMRNIASQKIS